MMRRLLDNLGVGSSAGLLARGSLVSFLIQATGTGLIFVSEVVLARVLGAAGYGLFATVMAWLQVLVIVALLGSNNLLLRFVPIYAATADWSLMRGLIRYSRLGSLAIGAGIFAVTILLLAVFNKHISDDTQWAFLIGMATLPIAALSLQRQAILRGLHRIAAALSPELIVRPVLLILIAAMLAWVIGIPLSPPQALAANAAAVVAAFLLGGYLQRKAIPKAADCSDIGQLNREWMHTAIPLFLVAGMQLLIVRMDIILLGILTGSESAGVYAAASRISDLVVFALGAANIIVAPMIAGLHARNDMDELQNVLTLLIKGSLVFTIAIAVFVMIYGDVILGLFGSGYLAGYTPLQILVVGQLINALCGPVAFLLAMTGNQSVLVRILAAATVLNLVLNIVLIPEYGVIGAAVATGITTILWNVLMLHSVRRRLGVESSVLVLLRVKS